MDARGRAWCFTWNNPPADAVDALGALEAERLVVGKEVASTGTPHLQGYIRFKQPKKLSWWKTHFPQVHVELRKGSETEASAYCRKDGEVAIDRGVDFDEKCSGTRSEETNQIIDEIEQGIPYGVIRMRHKNFVFWYRNKVLDYMTDYGVFSRMARAPDDLS